MNTISNMERTLFIGAHPDDIEVKMGHLALANGGRHSYALVATLGRIGHDLTGGHCLCR